MGAKHEGRWIECAMREPPSTILAGTGIALPERRVESTEFDVQLGLEPGSVERMCGVRRRPVAGAEDAQEVMAATAARAALDDAGIKAGAIDLLLFAAAV